MYVLLKVFWLFRRISLFYLMFFGYFAWNVCFTQCFLIILKETYVLLNVFWLFHMKCMFYLRFFDYFLLGCCSEARSLTNPLRKGLITDWGWSEALSLKYPSREGLITDWSWSGACAFPNPLIKASSGLRCFALQWWDSWKLQVRDDYI